jgi:hypothetical protein
VPAGMGLEATRFKWRQNLSHVEVFVRLPGTVQPKQVGVWLCNLLLRGCWCMASAVLRCACTKSTCVPGIFAHVRVHSGSGLQPA